MEFGKPDKSGEQGEVQERATRDEVVQAVPTAEVTPAEAVTVSSSKPVQAKVQIVEEAKVELSPEKTSAKAVVVDNGVTGKAKAIIESGHKGEGKSSGGGLLSKLNLWGGKKKKDERGNALTEMLEKTEQKKNSLVGNILKNSDKPVLGSGLSEVNKIMLRHNEKQLMLGRLSSAVAVGVLIVSLLTQWVWISPDNTFLGMFGVDNLSVQRVKAERVKGEAEKNMKEARKRYEALISQDSRKQAVLIAEIIHKRVDWTVVVDHLDDVLLNASPYNPVTNKIKVTQYTLSSEDKKVVLGGVIQNEAADKIYSLISNIVDSIEESPFFKDVDFRQYAASEEEFGSYSSALRMNFYLQGEGENNDEDNLNYESTDYSKRRYRHSGFQFRSMESEEKNTVLEAIGQSDGVVNGTKVLPVSEGDSTSGTEVLPVSSGPFLIHSN